MGLKHGVLTGFAVTVVEILQKEVSCHFSFKAWNGGRCGSAVPSDVGWDASFPRDLDRGHAGAQAPQTGTLTPANGNFVMWALCPPRIWTYVFCV